MTCGIKETVTRRGEKKQKRIMNDTIERIHEKFLIENTNQKISYTTFCRLTSFWFQPPREAHRDICACIEHENMLSIVDALCNMKILPLIRVHNDAKHFTCNMNILIYMYGKCLNCKGVNLAAEASGENIDRNEEITFHQWKTKKETRNNTYSERQEERVGSLMDKFSEEMLKSKIHSLGNPRVRENLYRILKPR